MPGPGDVNIRQSPYITAAQRLGTLIRKLVLGYASSWSCGARWEHSLTIYCAGFFFFYKRTRLDLNSVHTPNHSIEISFKLRKRRCLKMGCMERSQRGFHACIKWRHRRRISPSNQPRALMVQVTLFLHFFQHEIHSIPRTVQHPNWPSRFIRALCKKKCESKLLDAVFSKQVFPEMWLIFRQNLCTSKAMALYLPTTRWCIGKCFS